VNGEAKPMSFDQKPDDQGNEWSAMVIFSQWSSDKRNDSWLEEEARIDKAGGFVVDGRLNGKILTQYSNSTTSQIYVNKQACCLFRRNRDISWAWWLSV